MVTDRRVVYTLDGVTKTMAEYVSGFVAASDRRIVEWTVPIDAPSTLYYYCVISIRAKE